MTDLPPLEARAPACLTPPPQDSGRRKTIGCKWGRALSTHISSPDSPGCAEAGGARAPCFTRSGAAGSIRPRVPLPFAVSRIHQWGLNPTKGRASGTQIMKGL